MILSSCAASEHLPLSAMGQGGALPREAGQAPLAWGAAFHEQPHTFPTNYVYVCVCAHAYVPAFIVCAHVHVPLSFLQNWNEQRSKGNSGSQFSPPTSWVLGLKHPQAWQQAPLPTQLPCQPALRSCTVLLGFTDDGEDAFSLNSCFPSVKFKGTTDPTSSLHGWKGQPESGNGVSMALTGPQWQRQKETGLKCS